MDGDWHEKRPTLIDSSGWALNPECCYLKLPYVACSSIGVLAFILDCGTIISLSQLHGAESLTQVYMKALDLYRDNPDLPVLGYDDGCKCT